jgi:HEAT repeats
MEKTKRIADLISKLAEVDPNQKEQSKLISDELIAIAGSHIYIGRSEGSFYIDAINIERNGELLKKVIDAYISARENYTEKLKLQDFDFTNYITDRYFILSQLVLAADKYDVLPLPEIEFMLISNDIEIEDIASKVLKGIGIKSIKALPKMLELMQKRGLNCYPYTIGETLVQLANSYPEVMIALKSNLNSGIDNLVNATLYTCSLMDEKSIFFYEDLMNIAQSQDGETKSLAIMALGSTGKKDESLCEFLLECSTSSEWYIRGNAINSLGMLKLAPERCLSVIINALNDAEGYDWTVQESAIKALGNYGNQASEAIPALKALRKRISDEGDSNWISEVKLINTALHKIRKQNLNSQGG